MIFEYIRDKKNRKIGVLVALDGGQIGWSKCNIKRDKFDKELGLRIATGRAEYGSFRADMPTDIRIVVEKHFYDRSMRYFKQPVVINNIPF